MKYCVTKEFRWEAGHQLLPGCYTAACSDCIHGHSYRCEITVEADCLDNNGMVVDFGILKRAFQPILDEWDHALLLPRVIADRYRDEVTLKKVVSLDWNPTAEQIAEEIAGRVELTLARRHDPERRRKVWLAWVRVWETVTSSATCILEMPP